MEVPSPESHRDADETAILQTRMYLARDEVAAWKTSPVLPCLEGGTKEKLVWGERQCKLDKTAFEFLSVSVHPSSRFLVQMRCFAMPQCWRGHVMYLDSHISSHHLLKQALSMSQEESANFAHLCPEHPFHLEPAPVASHQIQCSDCAKHLL